MRRARSAFGRMLDRQIRSRLTPFEVSNEPSASVIFAPHPDDETLGVGGLAHKMIGRGAKIEFVFVTDGTTSHARFAGSDDLRKRRESEALKAIRILGSSAERATFLRFADGRATEDKLGIQRAVLPLLQRWQPQRVFVPFRGDALPDHCAVNQAVRAALGEFGHPITVYEYPIWYWYHWPWVRLTGDLPGMWRKSLRQTFVTAAGLRDITAFNTQAYVGDVLRVKQAALAAHESQMSELNGNPEWPTLVKLSGGEFLKRLLTEYELFARYEVNR